MESFKLNLLYYIGKIEKAADQGIEFKITKTYKDFQLLGHENMRYELNELIKTGYLRGEITEPFSGDIDFRNYQLKEKSKNLFINLYWR